MTDNAVEQQLLISSEVEQQPTLTPYQESLVQVFESLQCESSVERFFDKLEALGLPVIAVIGTSRSGKSSLLETFPKDRKGYKDVLRPVAREFANRLNLDQKGNPAVAPIANIVFDDNDNFPLMAYARPAPNGHRNRRTNLFSKPTPVLSRPEPASWHNWYANTSAVIIMLENLYNHRVRNIAVSETNVEKTTQFLIAHRCYFDRSPDAEFILLDVPGELVDPARKEVFRISTRRLPRIAVAVVFVESLITLYVDNKDLYFNFKGVPLNSFKFAERALGIPWNEEDDHRNYRDASAWRELYSRGWGKYTSLPTPILSVISKFDYLDDMSSVNFSYSGINPEVKRAESTYSQKKNDFVDLIYNKCALDGFCDGLLQFLTSSEDLISALDGDPAITFWSGMKNDLRNKLPRHRYLTHVPVQCHVADQNRRTTRCSHGSELVRWWIYDRVVSWYETMVGNHG